jgi:glyoxylate/hydroxypyruvate reductase A
MSILIIFENKNPQLWADRLKEKLPKSKVEIYPYVKDNMDVEFVVCWKPKINLLSQYPKLKVIQSVGASVDHIVNSQTNFEKTIITRIVDPQLSNDMWEFLLALVLSQLKNIPLYGKQQEAKVWKQKNYRNIKDTTISILGLGKIGSFVAERFADMGFTVQGWSASLKDIPKVKCFAGKHEFDLCVQDANFLINILPLTKETEGILNKQTLTLLPAGSFLINVGRGEHINETDLIELLDETHLSGALLDVFPEEPLPDNHLFWNRQDVQITPHIASLTHVESAIDQVVDNYLCFKNGENLKNVVSLQKGY